jgi:SAM-dependent methyltransferase
MDNDHVRRYYDSDPQREWDRLEVLHDRVEYALTIRTLDEHLPKPPASILDLGGGPGRYSIELARRGYAVTLADLSRPNLDFARERAAEANVTLAGVEQVDARDLSRFRDASFDVALLMGPLYHLLEERDRRSAVAEVRRVLRPSGRIFAVFITRYAPLRFWAKHNPSFVLDNREAFEEMIVTGRAPNAAGFTDLYMERPQESSRSWNQPGFERSASSAARACSVRFAIV